MLIKAQFEYEDDVEYIDCRAQVGRDIHRLQREFFRWLENRENDHGYWFVEFEEETGETIVGLSYRTDAFVYWLNHVRFTKRPVARLIDTPKQHAKKMIRF